jgi:hypothetical protein
VRLLISTGSGIYGVLGTGHNVSTVPGWRVAPDFWKKFYIPNTREKFRAHSNYITKIFRTHILKF